MDLTFVPVVFLVGAVVLVGWGLSRRQALGVLPQDWRRVTGTVIEIGGSPRVEYASGDGRRLRLPVPPATTLLPGSSVELLVDPTDASRARLAEIDREAERLVRLLIGLGIGSLVLAALAAVAFL